jgi:hypothetical protein
MKFNPWSTNVFLRVLMFVWSIPTTLIGFLIIFILFLSQQIKKNSWKEGALDFTVLKDTLLYKKMNNKWGAFSIGLCVVYANDHEYNNITTRMHERVHTHQQLVLGIFQWIFYALFYIVILAGTKLDGYSANPFEIDARLRSGQILDIEKLSKL